MIKLAKTLLTIGITGLMALSVQAVERKTGPSGNPLPRFVSIAATKAYMRTGPGRQYPIDWEYNRKWLPMEVIDEHGPWRKVKDPDGATGWMLVSLLQSKRSAIAINKTRKLYKEPNALSSATLIIEAGVVGVIDQCQKDWCHLEVEGTEGWISKTAIWGVYNDEIFD